jgi:hypothetical protein
MTVAFVREDRDWQGARSREACDRDAAPGFNVRSRVERTIEQARAAPADNEHLPRGDQID